MKTTRLLLVALIFLTGIAAVFFSSPSTASSAPDFLGLTLTPTGAAGVTPTPVPPTPAPDPDEEDEDDALGEVAYLPPAGFAAETQVDQANMPAVMMGEPARLVIPGLNVNSPVHTVSAGGYTWDIRGLGSSIGWLAETARPTETGNVVLVGHVFVEGGAPFKHLNQMQPGQEVRLVMGSTLYVYRVTGSRLVDPRDTSVLRSDNRHVLTMMTCAQYDAEQKTYQKRLVVTAELVRSASQTVTAE